MASTTRGHILETAQRLTEGDRNKTYGDPKGNMACFANLVGAYINGKPQDRNAPLSATDGAVICCLLKISRIAVNPGHEDNYCDLAAYAGIAGECALPLGSLRRGEKQDWAAVNGVLKTNSGAYKVLKKQKEFEEEVAND